MLQAIRSQVRGSKQEQQKERIMAKVKLDVDDWDNALAEAEKLDAEADEDFTKALQEEHRIRTQPGLIAGRGNGDWGRITIRKDGSILLENVALSNIAIRNCDLIAESGEYPISFADRMNRLENFVDGSVDYPDEKLYAGHTHEHDGDPAQVPCKLCGRTRVTVQR
jgi:hypothetical protein